MKTNIFKPHVGIFGIANSGKSSFINYMTGQDVSIVSPMRGTTTDSVKKIIELPKIGPCVFIDTAGIDDDGELGEKRVQAAERVYKLVDLGILLIVDNQFTEHALMIVKRFQDYSIPFIILHSHSDIVPLDPLLKRTLEQQYSTKVIAYSIFDNQRDYLFQCLAEQLPAASYCTPNLFPSHIVATDVVVLVTPVDSLAPKDRLILPQAKALRDLLNRNVITVVLQPEQLKHFFENNSLRPKLVVTDSQAFQQVNAIIPPDVALTSFSILYANLNSGFEYMVESVMSIDRLHNGDNILIMESCSHHVTEDDIGRFKLPSLMEQKSNVKLNFTFLSGTDPLPFNLYDYAMIVQCGGCMLTPHQLEMRIRPFRDKKLPVCNYGMVLAHCNGIFERAISPLRLTN